MTSNHLLPYAAVIAALGVALLLVERGPRVRSGALLLVIAGVVPLGLAQAPPLSRIADHPALAAALLSAGLGLLVLGTAVALRWPWLVPIAGLVVALRFPLANPIRPVHYLVPLYLIIACGFLAVGWRSLRGGAPPPALGRIGWLLGAYVLLVATSLFWTLDLDRGAFEMVATYIPLGLLASLVARFAPTGPFLRALPAVQISIAVVLAGVAVYEWFTQQTFVANPKVDVSNAYSGMFRVNSLMYDPSMYGRVEVLALIAVVCLVVRGAPRARTLALAALVPIMFAGLAFTFSQTSFAALAAGLVAVVAIAWGKRAAAGLLLGVLALTAVVALTQPHVRDVLTRSPNTASSDRIQLAERGSQTFRSHPVGGTGLGGFGMATGVDPNDQARVAPHNVVVDVASELGIVGLALFGATLVAIVLAIRRLADPLVRLILAADLVALLVHGLTYDQFLSDPTWWAIAAIAATGATTSRAVRASVPVATKLEPVAT